MNQELSPQTLLIRYEWFKEASAQLDKKLSDIKITEDDLKELLQAYSNTSRSSWPSDDRTEYNQIKAELNGLKASYNQLAAEYNANMKKFNYAFTNIGDLPDGTTQPLPREFKPYLN
ncbi:hypothetical protein CFPU101_16880 [Chroococcus sp. FPU101]|nr:hypothetical protein CFPU101_16880 [Chroococcus sp. FPU101]